MDQTKGELYNLAEDPYEWYNLYDQIEYAAIREQLKTELLMHLDFLAKSVFYEKSGLQSLGSALTAEEL